MKESSYNVGLEFCSVLLMMCLVAEDFIVNFKPLARPWFLNNSFCEVAQKIQDGSHDCVWKSFEYTCYVNTNTNVIGFDLQLWQLSYIDFLNLFMFASSFHPWPGFELFLCFWILQIWKVRNKNIPSVLAFINIFWEGDILASTPLISLWLCVSCYWSSS